MKLSLSNYLGPISGFHPLGFVEKITSVEGAVFIFGKICLVIAVGLTTSFVDTLKGITADKKNVSASIKDQEYQEKEDLNKPLTEYVVIKDRNIFGVTAAVDPNLNAAPKPADVELRLVATNISSNGETLAIIENKKKSEQDVFEIGETVFNYAKIVKITASQVRLNHNGTEEVLELEDQAPSAAGENPAVTSNEEQTEFQVDSAELDEALANLPRLLSQARAVPYFRNGQSIGMRLFAIRAGSLYEKIGLKNGDILTAVNENSMSDPTQALKLFEQLKSERSIKVAVERNGSITNLSYSIN